jgi:membrane fusion protein (multidrug efflux system)
MKQGAIAAQDLSNARNTLDTARSALMAARQTLAAQQALIRGTDVEHNPQVLQAKAALDTARLNLSRTVIRAPFDGIVAQKTAQIGQRVDVGQVLMTVVPVDHAYVNANFKEGQLTRVRNGQPVTLTSDLYGSRVVFHGRVQGLSGGTGAAFAVIPAQNATGNWIKVVQRLPVRVALNSTELDQHPLRVGLSMNATIDAAQ